MQFGKKKYCALKIWTFWFDSILHKYNKVHCINTIFQYVRKHYLNTGRKGLTVKAHSYKF